MKRRSMCAVGAIASLLASVVFAAPPVVNPEQMDMGVDITAKIGKEKAKRNSMAASMKGGPGSAGKSDCGTVNINSNEKNSNSGVKDMFGKQSTTIVTGPVINMANCK